MTVTVTITHKEASRQAIRRIRSKHYVHRNGFKNHNCNNLVYIVNHEISAPRLRSSPMAIKAIVAILIATISPKGPPLKAQTPYCKPAAPNHSSM